MRERKELSEAARYFLEEFQRNLNDFAQEIGAQTFAIDKEENLVTEILAVQKPCKLILNTEDGRTRCKDNFKIAISLMKRRKEPIFVDCYAGFAMVCIPIIIREELIGAIISCGGREDRGESKERLREKFSKLADEVGIIVDRENFIRSAIEEVKIVNEKEMKKRAERLKKFIDILAEMAQTPLKEVFG